MLLLPNAPLAFPHPDLADDEGLIAVGGDLSAERLLVAYDHGIFPWYEAGLPILWWSPNPRAIIPPEALHVSRTMRRILRQERFRVTSNSDFAGVIRACAHRPGHGTWLVPEMLAAYEELHRTGHAHSVEVWADDQLVGGLYGVQRGALFAAESMFHRATNASKVALIATVRSLAASGVELFDVQFLTPHLASLGAITISRTEYLARVYSARNRPVSRTMVLCPTSSLD